jgi:hypothetical protein
VNTPRILTPVLLAAVALAAGCYNPKIKPGGLRCNTEFSAEYECPEGHYCLGGFCQKKGAPIVDSGTGDKPSTDGKVDGVDAPVEKPVTPDAGPDAMCLQPVAGCTPVAGKCDPMCQTGCGCQEKCSISSAGALTCVVPGGSIRAKEGRSCDFFFEGTANQTDNCEPGLVCLHDACGDLCARFCRTNADCPNSLCTRNLPGGLKACDVSTVECNPVKVQGSMTGCPGITQGCYLSSTVKDRTVCDCSSGGQAENSSCTLSRECFPGLACVDPTGAGSDFRCRRVCSLTAASGTPNGCNPGFTCRPFLESQKYGYCN